MLSLGGWFEPADDSGMDAKVQEGGYRLLWQDVLSVQLSKAPEKVTRIAQRFPGSKFGRTEGANLKDFLYWPGYSEWANTVHRVTMPRYPSGERLTWCVYLRPPSDLNGDFVAWKEIVGRCRSLKTPMFVELAADSFSLQCYEYAQPLGIEPWPEVLLPTTHKYGSITLLRDIVYPWHSNWIPISDRPRGLILDDMSLVPFARANGWSPWVRTHRLGG